MLFTFCRLMSSKTPHTIQTHRQVKMCLVWGCTRATIFPPCRAHLPRPIGASSSNRTINQSGLRSHGRLFCHHHHWPTIKQNVLALVADEVVGNVRTHEHLHEHTLNRAFVFRGSIYVHRIVTHPIVWWASEGDWFISAGMFCCLRLGAVGG